MNTKGRPRQHQPGAHWLASHALHIAGTAAGFGLVLGFIGYQQFRPDAAVIDLVYSSLQLLIIDGPDGTSTNSPPLLLDIARYCALLASSATLLSLMFHAGAVRSDAVRARRARQHHVVIGNTQIAEVLARTAVEQETSRRRGSVILLGDIPEARAASLRSVGVVVVPHADEQRLVDVLHGANRVSIACADDDTAIETLERVRSLVRSAEEETDAVEVRVSLTSPDLARLLRVQFHNLPAGTTRVSAVSVPEVVAAKLMRHPWTAAPRPGTREHVVVIGDGDLAHAIATAAVERRARRGSEMTLTMLTPKGAPWVAEVAARAAGSGSRVVARHGPVGPEWVAQQVGDVISEGESAQVFVAGIPDPQAYAVGHHLATQMEQLRLITALGAGLLPPELLESPLAEGSCWERVVVAELLASPNDLDMGLAGQLGPVLLENLRRHAMLPGNDHLRQALTPLLAESEHADEWSRSAAETLMAATKAHRYTLSTRRPNADRPLVGEVLATLRGELQRMLQAEATTQIDDRDYRTLLRCAAELPEMLRGLGYELLAPRSPTR